MVQWPLEKIVVKIIEVVQGFLCAWRFGGCMHSLVSSDDEFKFQPFLHCGLPQIFLPLLRTLQVRGPICLECMIISAETNGNPQQHNSFLKRLELFLISVSAST